MYMVVGWTTLHLLFWRSIRGRGSSSGDGTLPFIPWNHPLVSMLANVVVVGAYWWSFFTCNLVSLQSGRSAVVSFPQDDPVLVDDRVPPDKCKWLWQFPTAWHLTNQELRYCLELVSVLLLLHQEGRISVPRPILPVVAVLLLMYALPRERRLYTWFLYGLAEVIYWMLWCLQQVWFVVFYGIAVVEAYGIRPYIWSWMVDLQHLFQVLYPCAYQVWLMAEQPESLLLSPLVGVDWSMLLLLLHLLHVAVGLKARLESTVPVREEGPLSGREYQLMKQRAHRKVKKVLRKRNVRLCTVLQALMLLPNLMTSRDERAFAASVAEFCDVESGMLLTDKLPPEKLIALRSQLQDFCNDQALKGITEQAMTFPIVWDSGASAVSTPIKDDFVSGTYHQIKGRSMKGISKALEIAGKGLVKYEMIADDGKPAVIEVMAYHIPDLPVRLLSPQAVLRSELNHQVYEYAMRAETSVVRLSNGREITVPYNATSKLPILYASCDLGASSEALETSLTTQLESEKNQNLTAIQKMMLDWHHKLNHLGYSHIRWLAKRGLLGNKAMRLMDVADKELPLCATCLYGKQKKRAAGTVESRKKPDRIGALKKRVLAPGQVVAVDHYTQTTPGRGAALNASETVKAKYIGGTVFVDLATGRVKVHHQTSLNAAETIGSKSKFEQEARQYGVKVQNYHCDNGTFTARDFVNHVWNQEQGISFSGVGAKFQNGVAESAVRTSTYMARTMMLHAAIRWPEVYSADLWPFAMSYACHVYNNIPRQDTGMSPEEMYLGSKVDHEEVLASFLPWGCPAYVLQPQLQDDNSLPKWKPRSRRGQFLGVSEFHCQKTVTLVRNLFTQRVSPQFHTVMDPGFSTVYAESGEPPPEWEDLLIHSQYKCDLDLEIDGVPPLLPEWMVDRDAPASERRGREEESGGAPPIQTPRPVRQPVPVPAELSRPFLGDDYPANLPTRRARGTGDDPVRSPAPAVRTPRESVREEAPRAEEAVPSRPKRESRAVERFTYPESGNPSWKAHLCTMLSYLSTSRPRTAPVYDAAYLSTSLFCDPEEGTVEEFLHGVNETPWGLVSKKGKDPDLPTYAEAMGGPHSEEFKKGQEHEIAQLKKKDTWVEIDREKVPKNKNVIKSCWAFKIARLPSGEIKKFRSRFCVRGDTQIEGVDVFETYAPVVAWSTVRMLMALTAQLKLKTRAADISNAFVSSPLGPDEEIYVEMPRGFEKEGKVLKLKKSLYGLRQSPKLFFEFLRDSLIHDLKFKQSENDQCLFIKKDIVAVIYVDDVLLFSRSNKVIDKVLTELEDKFELTKDDVDQDVFAYLGIQVERGTDEEGNAQISLIQPALINKIITKIKQGTHSTKDAKTRTEHTPASTDPLHADKDGEVFREEDFGFAYASAIGMLMYCVNTRPDIQYAVHAASRFTHSPKASHGRAIQRIARYLKCTKDKGIIIKPTSGAMEFNCYVDSDFAGLFGHEDSQDPVCVKSRTGYVFTLGETPVHWVSKLQSTISLSSVESEYAALSMALREFLPMRKTAEEICKSFHVDIGKDNKIKSKVFEDNNGCLALATAKRMNPRTKHIATVYHWFHSHLTEDSGIELEKIDTTKQKADIMTKGLDKQTFITIRKLLMGW